MKKCVHCRAQVEETVARIVCQGGKGTSRFVSLFLFLIFLLATKRKSFSKVGVGVVSSEPPSNLSALQQQLQVLKEKVRENKNKNLIDLSLSLSESMCRLYGSS